MSATDPEETGRRHATLDRERANEFFKAYEEYSKTLRTWLVAYGIGAPVLLLTNDRVAKLVAESHQGRVIAGLFLSGVVLQVLITALNKAAMWICYYALDVKLGALDRWWCKAGYWISEQFWVDLLADLGALAAFALATWGAFKIVIS